MISITQTISIDETELKEEFVRSSGPGGQNVNKVATAVKLRFDVKNSPSLSDEVKSRLSRLAGKRMTEEGVFIIDARRFRTQEHNRRDAVERLVSFIQEAAEKPKVRHRTRPSQKAKKRRLDAKRRRGTIKKLRGRVNLSDD